MIFLYVSQLHLILFLYPIDNIIIITLKSSSSFAGSDFAETGWEPVVVPPVESSWCSDDEPSSPSTEVSSPFSLVDSSLSISPFSLASSASSTANSPSSSSVSTTSSPSSVTSSPLDSSDCSLTPPSSPSSPSKYVASPTDSIVSGSTTGSWWGGVGYGCYLPPCPLDDLPVLVVALPPLVNLTLISSSLDPFPSSFYTTTTVLIESSH